MQNIDYYDGQIHRDSKPSFTTSDPEYFSRMTYHHTKETERGKKNTSRMLFFISALCIISFTTGIIIGIKFAGGTNRDLIDDKTFQAVSNVSSKVSHMIKEKTGNSSVNTFPVQTYPFVIGINSSFSEIDAKSIARILSNAGHTVILSKLNGLFKLYIGPYKTKTAASQAINSIKVNTKLPVSDKLLLLSRK